MEVAILKRAQLTKNQDNSKQPYIRKPKMPALDLYYMGCSAPCRAVMMTAKLVGVELNLKLCNLMAGDHMQPDFLKINPQHNIPVLGDDDFYMNESRAICAYLVNKYAKCDKLYPKEPKIRARVDQRLYFDAGVFFHRIMQLYYPVMMAGAKTLDDKAKASVEEAVNFLEGFLDKNTFVACDHMTIADIALLASASTLQASDQTVFSKYPKILAWMDKCKIEIPDYVDVNEKGANIFGGRVQMALS